MIGLGREYVIGGDGGDRLGHFHLDGLLLFFDCKLLAGLVYDPEGLEFHDIAGDEALEGGGFSPVDAVAAEVGDAQNPQGCLGPRAGRKGKEDAREGEKPQVSVRASVFPEAASI